MTRLLSNVRILLFLATVALMTGCGGGGGSSSSGGGPVNTDCVLDTGKLDTCTLQ